METIVNGIVSAARSKERVISWTVWFFVQRPKRKLRRRGWVSHVLTGEICHCCRQLWSKMSLMEADSREEVVDSGAPRHCGIEMGMGYC